MGFDWKKLAWAQTLLEDGFCIAPEDIQVISENASFRSALNSKDPLLDFMPHPGWNGFIEI